MKIIIAGGSGFIGRTLIGRLLQAGDEVVLLSRNASRTQGKVPSPVVLEPWDGVTAGSWTAHLDGAAAVINLAGEPMGERRWTARQKERIRDSRIHATRAIVEGIASAKVKPEVLVNASAVGYYGDVADDEVTEEYPPGSDFLAEVCRAWESEALRARSMGVRVAVLRTSIALGDGGALARMLMPFRFFVGGPLGSGRQWFPWIHRDDVVSAIEFVLRDRSLEGPVNLAAPEPVRMVDFCRTLGRVLHRPSWFPVPAPALKLVLGEMSTMVLTGQKVIPRKLLQTGFRFRFSRLEAALKDIVR